MSSIIEERGSEYSNYLKALLGQYKNNLTELIDDSNKQLFMARKMQSDKWFKAIPIKKIQTGMFYLINYNFNDNKLYAPIFVIDYRVTDKNKHVIYAVNLDYLPFSYKGMYFQQIYNNAKQIFEDNSDATDVLSEKRIPVNFEIIYKTLQSNGNFHYSISAFDLNKIVEVFAVSTNMMHVITNCHMRPVNVALIKSKMEQYDKGSEIREKLEKLISDLETITDDYDEDIVAYYKRLRQLENNYKLFENEI